MIPTIRLHSQQLINPVFNNPKDLVSWMGGIQAQDYTMSKWAIGIRLKAGNLQTVNEALAKGDILRIHVMRPTWHYVAAEDVTQRDSISEQCVDLVAELVDTLCYK